MKKIVIVDERGNTSNALISEGEQDIKNDIANDRKATLKEHLYMGYLIIGTIAFTLGILISIKRLNGK